MQFALTFGKLEDTILIFRWTSGGAKLLSAELMKLCGFKTHAIITPSIFTPERCQGITIPYPRTFYPAGWLDATNLYDKKTPAEWDKYFKDSHTAHYYQSSRAYETKIMGPKNYGSTIPSLLHLATQHCPMSFWSKKPF